MSRRFEGRRFSFLRLFIALVVASGVAAGGLIGWTYTEQNRNIADRWFGGYVDVTVTPTYAFESLAGTSYRNLALSFLVAHKGECEPSWGGAYTLEEAARDLDVDRRILRTVQSGQEILLSFGGQLHESLAMACDTASSLAKAYGDAIDRYDAQVIDLDIEGDDLSHEPSLLRRVLAVKQLQDEALERGETLGVWLTLPAARTGLTAEGAAAVRMYLEEGVTLAGVNLMVMNFGVSSVDTAQGELSIEALQSAHAQLRNLFWLQGDLYSNEQLWRRLGATPMIGQNDFGNEVFTLQDARSLRKFADEVGLGRLSFWSLNRDEPCDANYPNWSIAATFCSGVPQTSGEFAQTFADGLLGGAAAAAEGTQGDLPGEAEIVQDNPETSPYPIWSGDAAYAAGSKVVWKGNVYEAQWWNRAEQPDEPAVGGAPWRLIGPVMPDDKPIVQPKLPDGFFANWSPESVYQSGDRVMHVGEAYEAKWWTQGDSPDSGSIDPGSSPWEQLTPKEIKQLLDAQ